MSLMIDQAYLIVNSGFEKSSTQKELKSSCFLGGIGLRKLELEIDCDTGEGELIVRHSNPDADQYERIPVRFYTTEEVLRFLSTIDLF